MISEPGAWSRTRWILALALSTLSTRAPVFFYPLFNGDEATYAALANAMLNGQWLYVGAVDHKPPLISVTYAAVFAVAGQYSLQAVHAWSVCVVFCTALLVAAFARRVGVGQGASRLAALAYVVSCAMGPGQDMLAANAELMMALPAMAGLVLMAGRRPSPGSNGLRGGAVASMGVSVAAGVCIGVAALFKYQAIAVLAPALLVAWMWRPKPDRIWSLAGAAAGSVIPAALLIGGYAAAGHLDALQFWAWSFPLTYAGALRAADVCGNAAGWTLAWTASNAVLVVSAWMGWRSNDTCSAATAPRGLRLVWVVWLACAALGVAAGGRFFLHYYLQLVPPLCVFAAVGVPRLMRRVSPTVVGVGVLAPLLLFWFGNVFDPYVRTDVARDTRVYRMVGEALRQRATPGETLFVWGNSSQIYAFARMPMGTRFPFCNYQTGKMWGTPADREGASDTDRFIVPESWPMLLTDLDTRRPTWIVDAAEAGLDRWTGRSIATYPALVDVVSRRYEVATRVAGATLYRRLANQEP